MSIDAVVSRIDAIRSRIEAVLPPSRDSGFAEVLEQVTEEPDVAASGKGRVDSFYEALTTPGFLQSMGSAFTLGQYVGLESAPTEFAYEAMMSGAGSVGSVGSTSESGSSSVTTGVASTTPPAVDGDIALEATAPPGWGRDLPTEGRVWQRAIEDAAAAAGVDARLLAAVAWAESGFHPRAVSSAGAIGLTQLMPGTASGLGVDPWDPEQNLDGGARYLAEQIERFGRVDLGLSAYNAGPGRVIEHGNTAPSYTHAYVNRVLDYYQRLGGAA